MSFDVHPTPIESVTAWDHEADVVIAGYGIAGVAAGVEAARADADVLVLERAGWRAARRRWPTPGSPGSPPGRPDIAIGGAQARERMWRDLRRLLGHDDGSWDA